LSFDLVNIYDIYHIDLYSLVFIFIALRPLFVKYKYVTYLKITDNFCVVMGLICSVFAFLMGAGTLENLAI
jgi:hypothetical protein